MRRLSKIDIAAPDGLRSVELYHGDLTQLSGDSAVDILVVSAFPDNYLDTSGSVVGALARVGISVAELARDKDRDLRSERSCWLSKPMAPGRGFDRLLCFEPLRRGTPLDLVDDIFDSLDQVLLGDHKNASVAMSLVATGNMGWPTEEMANALVKAGMDRLKVGLPLRVLRLVERDADKALQIKATFDAVLKKTKGPIAARPRRLKVTHGAPAPPPPLSPAQGDPGGATAAADRPAPPAETTGAGWDCFVSYSREDSDLVDEFINSMRALSPGVRVFKDSEAIRTGGEWITVLADAIDSSRRFVALFSPDYFSSKWCRREFSAAIIRDDQGDDDILFPIYLRRDRQAPSLYMTFNHVDCCEADKAKLQTAAERLVQQLDT